MKIHRKKKPFPIKLKDGWSTRWEKCVSETEMRVGYVREGDCVDMPDEIEAEKHRAWPTSQKGQEKG